MIWDKEERTRVDIVIAKRIAAVLNRKLHILKMHKKEDSQRIAEWDTHCGNLALGRTMYTRHIYDSVSYQPIITVGSNIYELIEDTYAHEFTAADLEEIFATKGAYFKEAMQEWRDLVSKDTINDYIKESIRMYWDLRMGCWLAAKMQALDIADNITRVHLLNCRKHVALLLALSGNMKDNRLWQQMVINDLCPSLKEIPYDVEYESFRVSLKRGLEKVARKMKETLSPRLYNFFFKIFGKILHKF